MRALTLSMAALAAATVAVPAMAQEQQRPSMLLQEGTLLEVSAEGRSTRVPDIATIDAGVTTQAATAAEALAQNNAKMTRVIAALKGAGVAERDIQTATISLQPQYRDQTNGQPQQIFAYMASNTVSVRFRDVARSGAILDLLVTQGANTISGPNLGISEPAQALDEARIDAVAKARARAELYAKAAGLRVDRILSISDGVTPTPFPMRADRMSVQSAGLMVNPGEQELSVSVTIRFLLK